jgi:hypothetical protein
MAAPSSAELSRPKAYANKFPRPENCEAAARATLPVSRDKAWEVLTGCVEKGTFTILRRVLDGTWDKELQAKPDSALVLAKIIAARGGDVTGDLNFLRQRKIPIFGIGAAAGTPNLYQGRLVMVRARVDEVKTDAGKTTVRLAEFAVAGSTKFVEGDKRAVRDSSWGSSRWSVETKRGFNTPQETGLMVLGKLAKPDPFFEPGRQFVILGRFDGVREVPGDQEDDREAEKMPVMSVVSYIEPASAIVE